MAEEPEVLLKEIKKAVRAKKPLSLTFKDHRGHTWSLSLVLMKERGK
jgi:hypothetical protein